MCLWNLPETIKCLRRPLLKGPSQVFSLTLFSQTKGSYDFILQSSDSYSSYMENTLKERTTQTKVSFGFAVPGVFEFGFNYNSASYSKSVRKLRRVSGKVRHSSSELL